MKNVLKQLGKVLCYVALFLGMHVIVVMASSFGYGIVKGVELAGSLGPDASKELVAEVLEAGYNQFLAENMNLVLIIADILVVLFLWVFFAIRKKRLTTEACMRKYPVSYVPWIILMGAALAVFISFAMTFLPEAWLTEYAAASEDVVGTLTAVALISTVLVAPAVEEILFRGIILSRLRKAMPAAPAILLSALVFGLMHGQMLWIAYAAFLGIILALVAVRTKSILATILLHVTFNFTGMLVPRLVPEASGAVYMAIAAAGAVLTAVGMIMILRRRQSDVQDSDHRGGQGDQSAHL